MEPLYNEDLGTMKITLLYQVSHYIRVKKQRNIKSWDQQNYLVIRGFCYIRPRYNEVPLYNTSNQEQYNLKVESKLNKNIIGYALISYFLTNSYNHFFYHYHYLKARLTEYTRLKGKCSKFGSWTVSRQNCKGLELKLKARMCL